MSPALTGPGRLMLSVPTGNDLPRGEQRVIYQTPRADHVRHPAFAQVIKQHDIRPPARHDHAPVTQAEGIGGAERGAAIGGQRLHPSEMARRIR